MAARIRGHYAALGGWPGPEKIPLVYNSIYNIGFMGLENLHPFDSKKYSKVSASIWGAVVLAVLQCLVVAAAEGNTSQGDWQVLSVALYLWVWEEVSCSYKLGRQLDC